MAVNSLQGATDPISKSIINAKGDIIAGTADNTIDIVSVGIVDGAILKIKSSSSTGLEWGTLDIETLTIAGAI